MIDLSFRSPDGPITVQLGAPVPTPEAQWPWAVEVRLDGRASTVPGWDLLGAMEGALHLLSGYLSDREGLDPPVVPLPLRQPPDLIAQGFHEGILAVLDVRGIACPDEVRGRIAACVDPAVLRRLLARAKTAGEADDLFELNP